MFNKLPEPKTGNPETDKYLKSLFQNLSENDIRYPLNGSNPFVVDNLTESYGSFDPATVTTAQLAAIVGTLLKVMGKSGILLTKEI